MSDFLDDLSLKTLRQLVRENEQYEASQFTYDSVQPSVDDLKNAVASAIAADDTEANDFQVEEDLFTRDSANYLKRRERFDNQVNELKKQAGDKVTEVENLYKGPYADRAADAAEKLRVDSQQWGSTAKQLDDLREDAKALMNVPGWSGKAAQDYAATVQVQVNALAELQGIAESLRQSCSAGELLNRVLLFLLSKYIKDTALAIQSAPGRSGYTFYRRTAYSVGAIESLLTHIQPDALTAVAQGSVDELTGQLRHTASMPALLKPGRWPADGSLAGVAPVDTSQGVTATGEGTNLNTGRDDVESSGVRR